MKIIVDAMGGDNAPQAIVQGALDAHKKHGVDILLVGRAADVLRAVEACGEKTLPAGVELKDASEVVEIADDPATAFKMKKDSSLTVGLNLLKAGEGDAFVSAGSTGALLSGATLLVKRIRGIRRAAMGPVIPTFGGRAVLCDCGANAECTPEYLLQFAYLGNYYAKRVLGVEKPRVALLNIGAEEEKGDTLRHETYALLQAASEAGRLRFTGNIEASDVMMGGADVVVADGFTGNVMLKSLEGTGKFLLKELKKMFLSSTKTKLAAALVKSDMADMKKLLDPSEIGGTPFLGISKPVIKAHGSSDARAICNAVLRAKEYAESGFIADIEANIDVMKLERTLERTAEKI
ncbi:phosphate acyltransferase PlsX [Oscillibacter valericigenes]|uniref:phosphate acyltransferase PlsX n=1 Tax=Oscillibacter valericigenes TaxID=351091 RepID=UPI001F2DB152|nr:phosphate acyltransferase PlsX [Oscillibacter valericigenes]MCF2617502.1 phosphate acyltransferase PlsX [Oscillibacter valericigenes]